MLDEICISRLVREMHGQGVASGWKGKNHMCDVLVVESVKERAARKGSKQAICWRVWEPGELLRATLHSW